MYLAWHKFEVFELLALIYKDTDYDNGFYILPLMTDWLAGWLAD